ncbi:MAG: DUF4062 domain-containing protein [Cytophagaceae bacterium]|nr:DUF4062 domain-containing protein [Cytophagaceae bacterium]
MKIDLSNLPKLVHQVMVSSTFTDLINHRKVLIELIDRNKFKANVMENDSALPDIDIIESSLNMVRDSSAYIAVISFKYGQIPEDDKRNPDRLSITELEFRKAVQLARPILLFIMGEDHPTTKKDIEPDSEKNKKLEAFKNFAKIKNTDSKVHRIYREFNSLEEFKREAGIAVSELRSFLDKTPSKAKKGSESSSSPVKSKNSLPHPPQPYYEPAYIGSHKFVGRKEQLETLDEWASAADTHSLLLFDAIGGSGKSMLTWEWTKSQAQQVRNDWAGIFWYSFYEKGAIMADFCRRALAYMTGEPLEKYDKRKTADIEDKLIRLLQMQPWLIVLDGLERVLVHYHRIDAAQVRDEEAGTEDKIFDENKRNPCDAIRPEDNDLLRKLASGTPSKILISSRLVPRVLLNNASQTISGVKRIPLEGLKPADAEELIRSCGITGDSHKIQNYLKANCDCHPLVIGVLAGLISHYLPERGNFDVWVEAADGGAKLNLAEVDLVQRRNHILLAAFDILPKASKQVLGILSLISSSVDVRVLMALNPHYAVKPKKVEEPDKDNSYFDDEDFEEAKQKYEAYKEEYARWEKTQNNENAIKQLTETIEDLENRGLIQYDNQSKLYDLHPVVRGVVLGKLNKNDKEDYGSKVIDYFSNKAHDTYDDVTNIEVLNDAITIIRVYIQLENYKKAFSLYHEISKTLLFNLEAYQLTLSILKPFCNYGLLQISTLLDKYGSSFLLNQISLCLSKLGLSKEALSTSKTVLIFNIQQNTNYIPTDIRNLSSSLSDLNQLQKSEKLQRKSLEISIFNYNHESIFKSKMFLFKSHYQRGEWEEAQTLWNELDSMGRSWDKGAYRQGEAEYQYCRFLFYQNKLSFSVLEDAIQLCQNHNNRTGLRYLYSLKGKWLIEQKNYQTALEPLQMALKMANEVGLSDTSTETLLAIAKLHLGLLEDPQKEAARLHEETTSIDLAELWYLVGNIEKSKSVALEAYKWYWADGEPYVNRYYLEQTKALLHRLGVEIPNLPPFDPSKEVIEDYEIEIDNYIQKLKEEKGKK